MNPIYKKKEAVLNWMNLLASGGGTIMIVYYIIFKIDFSWVSVVIGCLGTLLFWSFVLNLIEYERLNKDTLKTKGDEK